MKWIEKTTRVFKVSTVVAGVIILAALVFPRWLYEVTSSVRDFEGCNFGWFYLLLATMVVGVCIYWIFSFKREMGLFVKARKYPEKDEPFRSYENGDGEG